MGRLEGKVAIVTGGNGGIGRAIALALAEEGARTAVAARNPDKNRAVAAELEALGVEHLVTEVDIVAKDAAESFITRVHEKWGRLDVLVNNAGTVEFAETENTPVESWDRVIATNLTAAFVWSKHAIPHMRAQGGGKIINMASMYSIFGALFFASYAASKGGIVALTRSLALELAPHNIQVNALAPGWVLTDMTTNLQGTDYEKEILARTPAGRWGLTDDVKGPAVFLASDASNFVTGQVLAVDGGFSVR
jgi:2-deoxy-D-gluconate 3-dehydrogenase